MGVLWTIDETIQVPFYLYSLHFPGLLTSKKDFNEYPAYSMRLHCYDNRSSGA